VEVILHISIVYSTQIIGKICHKIYYLLFLDHFYTSILAFYIDPVLVIFYAIIWLFFRNKTKISLGKHLFVYFILTIIKCTNMLIAMMAVAH
jgi:hypothetical protein